MNNAMNASTRKHHARSLFCARRRTGTSLQKRTLTKVITTRSKKSSNSSDSSVFEKIKSEATKMLDVMEGGPKLRKWYGEDSSVGKDGEVKREREDLVRKAREEEKGAGNEDDAGNGEYDANGSDEPKRAIYVLDSDSKLGDACVMQLVLAKLDVRVACADSEVEQARYGPYVSVTELGDEKALRKSLNGVRSVIVPARKFDKSFLNACEVSGVKHIVLISCAKSSKGLSVLSLFDEAARARKDESREKLAMSTSIAVTIIKPVTIVDTRTSGKQMKFDKNSGALSGNIPIEDVAVCAVRALSQPPKKGSDALVFELGLSSIATGKMDWKEAFASLK